MDGTVQGELKVDEKRQKDEKWARYTDENPRGAGNKMNRGWMNSRMCHNLMDIIFMLSFVRKSIHNRDKGKDVLWHTVSTGISIYMISSCIAMLLAPLGFESLSRRFLKKQWHVSQRKNNTEQSFLLVLGSPWVSFSIPGRDMAIFLNKLLTLCPAFAEVSMNIMFSWVAFVVASSSVTCLDGNLQ